ncbi:Protein of unknown function [Bacillus thuringiensis]|uniref:Uncharacterized protein n=1 Tax=Bacillus thuringiensis TaxID=1428 RepID=A0A1C4GDC1_BACTU|nr:Protein of unknown function [Bacillus thuringiensis]
MVWAFKASQTMNRIGLLWGVV